MKWKIVGVALTSLCCAAMASSPEKVEAPAVDEVAPKADERSDKRPVTASERYKNANKMRCVKEEVTGSRFARRVCHTEEEWRRMREAGEEVVKNIQKSPIPLEVD